MTDTQKIKVSREEFANALFYWLTSQVNTKKIKQLAKLSNPEHKEKELFGLNLEHKTEFNILVEELFDLNMWLIVHVCERVFEDTDKRDECLDIFHHLEYGRYLGKEEKSFSDWMMSIAPRYVEYGKAMETKHSSTPLWVVASVFNKRLFGEIRKDLGFQMKVIVDIGLFVKYLGEAIKQYDIE